MDTLPYELISYIGKFLIIKYRLRLYISCKYWYNSCLYNNERYLCNWYQNMYRYYIINYKLTNNYNKDDYVSRRIKPNGGDVYIRHLLQGCNKIITFSNKNKSCTYDNINSHLYVAGSENGFYVSSYYIIDKAYFTKHYLCNKNKYIRVD